MCARKSSHGLPRFLAHQEPAAARTFAERCPNRKARRNGERVASRKLRALDLQNAPAAPCWPRGRRTRSQMEACSSRREPMRSRGTWLETVLAPDQGLPEGDPFLWISTPDGPA